MRAEPWPDRTRHDINDTIAFRCDYCATASRGGAEPAASTIDQMRRPGTGAVHALWLGGSTTTVAPCLTRSKRSMTSSLVMRMQPEEMAWPIYSGWLVPWTRYNVSLLP